jgi:hypothetical protein
VQGSRDQLDVQLVGVQGTEDVSFAWPMSITRIDTNGEIAPMS